MGCLQTGERGWTPHTNDDSVQNNDPRTSQPRPVFVEKLVCGSALIWSFTLPHSLDDVSIYTHRIVLGMCID